MTHHFTGLALSGRRESRVQWPTSCYGYLVPSSGGRHRSHLSDVLDAYHIALHPSCDQNTSTMVIVAGRFLVEKFSPARSDIEKKCQTSLPPAPRGVNACTIEVSQGDLGCIKHHPT